MDIPENREVRCRQTLHSDFQYILGTPQSFGLGFKTIMILKRKEMKRRLN